MVDERGLWLRASNRSRPSLQPIQQSTYEAKVQELSYIIGKIQDIDPPLFDSFTFEDIHVFQIVD